jgi:hypothetical protein
LFELISTRGDGAFWHGERLIGGRVVVIFRDSFAVLAVYGH